LSIESGITSHNSKLITHYFHITDDEQTGFETRKIPSKKEKGRANLMTLPLKLIQNFMLILFSGYSSHSKKTKTEEEEGGWFWSRTHSR
jgi:hypothetical protein